MAHLKIVDERVTGELDWAGNYCLKRLVERYRFEVLNESNVRVRALASAAIDRLDFWYSEEACTGFDVIEFLRSGRVFGFDQSSETIEAALAACEGDEAVPVRTCSCSIAEEPEPLELQQVGPIRDERLVRALLLAWREPMVNASSRSAWLSALVCLFDLFRRAEDPNGLLDRLRQHTASFGRYDGEFCAHSAGELFARPLLDCAAVLAHADVVFEREGPNEYRARGVDPLAERHFEEFVVPGLALLLIEHLGVERTLTRFDSIKYSGDRCWIASFGCERLPRGSFGHEREWPEGARFVFGPKRTIDEESFSLDGVEFVIVVEPSLKLHFLAR